MKTLVEVRAIEETSRAASRRAFQLSEAQLQAGTVNLITVLQTEQTLTEQTVRRIEEKLLARFGGRENWHRPLVLEQGLRASPWTLTPAEMDYLNSSRMTRSGVSVSASANIA